MKRSATAPLPLTVHRATTASPLGMGTYRWVIKRGTEIVGYFGTRKAAEDFIALSATYRR